MSKKSLIISDEEKYGPSSPTAMMAEGGKKESTKPKHAPTIELTGSQVDAFCSCSLVPGETGTATVHFTVKSVEMGKSYGTEIPTKDSQKRVTLQLTDVEAEGEPDGGKGKTAASGEEPGDGGEKETDDEDVDGEGATGEESPADEEDDLPEKQNKGQGDDANPPDDDDEDAEASAPAVAKGKSKGKKSVGVKDTGLDNY